MTRKNVTDNLAVIVTVLSILGAALGGFTWVTQAISAESSAVEARLSHRLTEFQQRLDGTNARLDRLIELQLQLVKQAGR